MKKLTGLVLRLVVTVKYDLNGTDPEDLEFLLENAMSFAAGEGLMTDDSAAEVYEWNSSVERVAEVFDGQNEE